MWHFVVAVSKYGQRISKRHGLNGGEGYGKSKSKHRALQGVQTVCGRLPPKSDCSADNRQQEGL